MPIDAVRKLAAIVAFGAAVLAMPPKYVRNETELDFRNQTPCTVLAATTPAQSRVAPSTTPQLTAAERFALELEKKYQQNGYDIDVSVVDHELRLKSDLLQDANLRESLVNALRKDSHTLCGLEIWYLKVGYSKGWFSSDVMKSASLGCPAAKAARLQETKSSRDELAAQLNSPEEGVKIHADGTTLVCESDFFTEADNRTRFVQLILGNRQKLCDRGFSAIQLAKGGKVIKTVPIQCQ